MSAKRLNNRKAMARAKSAGSSSVLLEASVDGGAGLQDGRFRDDGSGRGFFGIKIRDH